MLQRSLTILKQIIIIGLTLFLVAGCGEERSFRNQVGKPVLKASDDFLDTLLKKDADKALGLMVPELRNREGLNLINKGIDYLAATPVQSKPPFEVVFYNASGEIFGAHHEVTYQVKRERGWLLVHIGVDDVYKRYYGVTDIDFRYIPIPLKKLNAFTFKGKPWRHYVVLGVCVAILGTVIFSLVLLLRTPTRKPWIWWVWFFLILIGFVRVNFNWTSGEFTLYPTGSAGQQVLYHLGWVVTVEHDSPYEPWYIQFMLPAGALLFLWRRKSLVLRAAEEKIKQETGVASD